MNEKFGMSQAFQALREKAEQLLQERGSRTPDLGQNDLLRLTHELEVNSIELEVQNEELRRAQKELEESRDEFFDLYDSAPVAYVTLNKKGIIEKANQAAFRMFENSGEILLGSPFLLWVYTDDLPVYHSLQKELTLRREAGPSELRLRGQKNLIHVQVEARLNIDGEGREERRLALADITGRKRMEEELSRSRDELEIKVRERTRDLHAARKYAEGIVETIQEPLLVLDENLRVLSANDAFYRTFKVSPEETEKGFIYDIGNRQWDIPKLRSLLEDIISRDQQFQGFEVEHDFPAIGRKTMVLNARRITQEEKGMKMILLAIEDITERKELESQRVKLEEHVRQKQKMEALGTLAGGITHDFNNILASIAINAGLAVEDSPPGTRLRRYLDMVLEGANRGRDLVKQIIAFSRQKEQERRPVRIAPVIEEGLKFLRISLAKNIEISGSLEKEADVVVADPIQIYQVLMNLCSNAAYAMREKGGRLGVRLTKVEVDEAICARNPDLKPGPYLNLSVSDTGTGMTREVKEKAFDPFFTTKKPGEGTGMGLAVVHGIVRTHGGAITVFSEVGTGSTFNVFLPRAGGEPEKERVPTGPIPGGTERILVVEDEKSQAESEQTMLERLGYKVTMARDGLKALEAFRKDPRGFDLVITDQTMPKMTGSELAAALLKIRPEIPVILCTGFSEVVDADEARAMGIREFVMKPFSVREMAEIIRKVLKA